MRKSCKWASFSRELGRFHEHLLEMQELVGVHTSTAAYGKKKGERRHHESMLGFARDSFKRAVQQAELIQRMFGHCTPATADGSNIRAHLRELPREVKEVREELERVEGRYRAESGMFGGLERRCKRS